MNNDFKRNLKEDMLNRYNKRIEKKLNELVDYDLEVYMITKEIVECIKINKPVFKNNAVQQIYNQILTFVNDFEFIFFTQDIKYISLSLRVMIENLIILLFLLESSDDISENWEYYSFLKMLVSIFKIDNKIDDDDDRLITVEELFARFPLHKEQENKLKNAYQRIGKNINRAYSFCNKVSLKQIVEVKDESESQKKRLYEIFKDLSNSVHANNSMGFIEIFNQNTFAQFLTHYIIVLDFLNGITINKENKADDLIIDVLEKLNLYSVD